jgi:hypothetical protein
VVHWALIGLATLIAAACGGESRHRLSSDDAGGVGTGGSSTGGALSVVNTGGSVPTGGVIGSVCEQPKLSRSVPNILLVVDRSWSMATPDGPMTRWENVRETLVGEDAALVAGIGGPARLGLAFFAGRDRESADPQCPVLDAVPIATITPEHIEELREGFAALEPHGTNPTGESLDVLWPEFGELDPDEFRGPNALVLLTDGEPDGCEGGELADLRARAEAAITDAYQAGVRTLIMALSQEISDDHLRRMANLGRGFPANDATDRFLRGGGIGVLPGLESIFQELVSCSFELDVSLTEERASLARVQVDDEDLTYRGPDGWYLDGQSRIVVQGAACPRIQRGGQLHVYLPCGGPIPLP